MRRLRRDRHRQRRRRRHARPPPRALGQADPAARARRLAAARAAELARAGRVRRQPLRLAGHLVRRRRQALPAPGPLLRRRRDEALRRRALPPARGGLRRAAPPRRRLARPGRSPTTSWSPTTPRPSSSTRCTARAARTRPSRRPARPTRSRRSPTSRASSSSRTTSRPPGYHPFHAPCGIMLDEANMPYSHCVRCPNCDGFPVPGPRQVRRRGARRAAGARAPQRHAADQRARPSALETNDAGHRGHRGRRRARRRDGERSPATSWSSPAAPPTRPSCCSALGQRQASRTGWPTAPTRSGRNYMFHDSQAVLALSQEENPTVFQKTLGLNDFYFGSDDFDYPLGNIQMVGKSQAPDVPRREAAARRSWRPSGRWSGSPATRSTSGSRPRTCRGPTTGSPSTATARSR